MVDEGSRHPILPFLHSFTKCLPLPLGRENPLPPPSPHRAVARRRRPREEKCTSPRAARGLSRGLGRHDDPIGRGGSDTARRSFVRVASARPSFRRFFSTSPTTFVGLRIARSSFFLQDRTNRSVIDERTNAPPPHPPSAASMIPVGGGRHVPRAHGCVHVSLFLFSHLNRW